MQPVAVILCVIKGKLRRALDDDFFREFDGVHFFVGGYVIRGPLKIKSVYINAKTSNVNISAAQQVFIF